MHSPAPAPHKQNILTVEEAAELFASKMMDGEPVPLNQIHTATVRHLVHTRGTTLSHAQEEAAKAICNLNARATPSRIDISKSTSTCIFIRHEGELRALSINEAICALGDLTT